MATKKQMEKAEATAEALIAGLGKREAMEWVSAKVDEGERRAFWLKVLAYTMGGGARRAVRKPEGRAAEVWAWLKKSDAELTFDAKLWPPDAWRKHGYDPGKAVFVITSEGPLYQLVNYHYDAPAADKLLKDFNKMLKSHGLWYELHEAWQLYFYDK